MKLTIEQQIARLEENRKKMENAIEERKNNPELHFMVHDLKKKKLKLKDEIEKLKQQLV